MPPTFDIRRIHSATTADMSRLRDHCLSGLGAMQGIDAPAHLRTAPAVVAGLGSGSMTAIAAMYADPYATRNERDGTVPAGNRSGTRPGVRDRVVRMVGLLTISQCRLGARGREVETLVDRYFDDRVAIPRPGRMIEKVEERWRAKLAHLPMFASAASTRTAVLCALHLYVQGSSGRGAREALRGLKARILADAIAANQDHLSQAVILAAIDFTHHSDRQIERTLAKLKATRLTQRRAKATFLGLVDGALDEADDVLGPVGEELFPSR